MTDEQDEIERRRLDRLRALQVLDTEPEPLFDSLALLASQLCGTPIALLSLIDAERQWFKAKVGLRRRARRPARGIAFCHHTITHRSADGSRRCAATMNASQAIRWSTGEPRIRFYAGAPLVMNSGERLGTLCVIDRQPRQLSVEQSRMLAQLADAAVQALEMRQRLAERSMELRGVHARSVVAESEARMRAILDAQSELVAQSSADGRLIYVNPAYARQFGRRVDDVVGSNLFDYVHGPDQAIVRERIEHCAGHRSHAQLREPHAAARRAGVLDLLDQHPTVGRCRHASAALHRARRDCAGAGRTCAAPQPGTARTHRARGRRWRLGDGAGQRRGALDRGDAAPARGAARLPADTGQRRWRSTSRRRARCCRLPSRWG
ncbi:MAG: PAS domain-containing protein [Piscinibacter sp.]